MTGTNNAWSNVVSSQLRMPESAEPSLLAMASIERSAARMRKTPVISRPCRGVSRGLVDRLLLVERERDDAARRAPFVE